MPPKQNCRLPRSVRLALDHNYAADPTGVDFNAGDGVCVKEETQQPENVAEERALQPRFGVRRFAASDGDICFFTR